MEGWVGYALGLLLLGFVLSRVEIWVLRRRERQILRREGEIGAWTQLHDERKAVAEEQLTQAYERGVADGEKAAQADLRVEYWTQVNRQQGYFFSSKEVLAFTQLMYRNIPVGPAQRHVLEKSEAVDRPSIERMLSKILGESAPPSLASSPESHQPVPGRLRLVKRDQAGETPASAADTPQISASSKR